MYTRIPRLLVTFCLALCLVGLMPARALAWGKEGHQMVAEIALWRLQQMKAEKTLKTISRILNAKMKNPPPLRPMDLYAAATWPDDIRNEKDYQFVKPLHFVSIVLNEKNDPNDFDKFDRDQECKPSEKISEGVCIIGGIEHYKKVLSTSLNRRARLEALSLIVHFLGDIHQPLHTSEDTTFIGVDKDGKKVQGDIGGNFRYIFYLADAPFQSIDVDSCLKAPNACTSSFIDNGVEKRSNKNLHSAWDSLMIRTEMSENPNRNSGFKEYAQDLIKTLPADPSDPKYAAMEAGDPVQWAEESHHLAELNAYALIGPSVKTSPQNQMKYDFYLLNRAYRDKNIKVIDEQLIRAGIRLAAVLKRIFP